MWLYIIIGLACLLGAYLWFGHVRFKQHERDILYVIDRYRLGESGRNPHMRGRFLNSHVFRLFEHNGFGTRSVKKSRRNFTLGPGDIVMVAKDHEFLADDPSELSDFEPCDTADAIQAKVISCEDDWICVCMPDGSEERVHAGNFFETGRCSTGQRFRAHPRQEEFKTKGVYVDFAAPKTRFFHVNVFDEVLREESEWRAKLARLFEA